MVLSKNQLGNLIKEARKEKSQKINQKYTQADLARDLDISRSYLGDIEAGRKYPNYVLLNKIAEICEVPFSYFGDVDKQLEIALYHPLAMDSLRETIKEALSSETFSNTMIEILTRNNRHSIEEAQKIVDEFITKDPMRFFHEDLSIDTQKGLLDEFMDNLVSKMVTPEEGIATYNFHEAYKKIKTLKKGKIDLNNVVSTILESIRIYPRLIDVVNKIPELEFIKLFLGEVPVIKIDDTENLPEEAIQELKNFVGYLKIKYKVTE